MTKSILSYCFIQAALGLVPPKRLRISKETLIAHCNPPTRGHICRKYAKLRTSGRSMTFLCIEASVELFTMLKIIKIGPKGHPNSSDRRREERKWDRVTKTFRLCRRKNAMKRARQFRQRAEAFTGRLSLAPNIALTRHHPQRTAPHGAFDLPRCKRIKWLKKCLSMPPTPRRLGLWWWTEPRLKNLTLNPN